MNEYYYCNPHCKVIETIVPWYLMQVSPILRLRQLQPLKMR